MALTKPQIIESVQNQIGIPKNKSSDILESLLKIIKSTLLSGEDVMISGFGRFCVKEKKEHRGRNTATGEDMILKPRSVSTKATFKPP